MTEIVIWSKDGPEEEIEIRCVKAVEKFWKKGVKQLEIEVRALHPDEDFPFALAAVYEDQSRTRAIARKLVDEAFPRLRYCSMFFYEEPYLQNLEGLLSREEAERELQKNLEWAEQKTREKLPATIKEKVEKGKELRVLLDTWIFCYVSDHETTYVLDAYDSYGEAMMLMDFLEEKANKLGKLVGFKLEKRTDVEVFSIDDERDAVYATVQIKSIRQNDEKEKGQR